MRIQWASAPRGASVIPTPDASSGQVSGSHRSRVKVDSLPVLTLPTSVSKNSCIQPTTSKVSSPRAAVRPSVENKASTGAPSRCSVEFTSSWTSSLPLA